VVRLDFANPGQHRPRDPVASPGLAVEAQVAGGDIGGGGPGGRWLTWSGVAGWLAVGWGGAGRGLEQAQVLSDPVQGDGQHEHTDQRHHAAQPEREQDPQRQGQQPRGQGDHRRRLCQPGSCSGRGYWQAHASAASRTSSIGTSRRSASR
jgi:hypothetical protein